MGLGFQGLKGVGFGGLFKALGQVKVGQGVQN